MAQNATGERVAGAIRPPNYRSAVSRIRSVKAKKEKIGSVNGEIADIWAKVEGDRVNKQAGKWFAKLDSLEPADRNDVLRSLQGLMDAAGWPSDVSDLADGGNVVNLRVDGRAANDGAGPDDGEGDGEGGDGDGDGEDGDGEGADEDGDPEPPRRARRTSGGVRGIAAAREHLGGAPA